MTGRELTADDMRSYGYDITNASPSEVKRMLDQFCRQIQSEECFEDEQRIQDEDVIESEKNISTKIAGSVEPKSTVEPIIEFVIGKYTSTTDKVSIKSFGESLNLT